MVREILKYLDDGDRKRIFGAAGGISLPVRLSPSACRRGLDTPDLVRRGPQRVIIASGNTHIDGKSGEKIATIYVDGQRMITEAGGYLHRAGRKNGCILIGSDERAVQASPVTEARLHMRIPPGGRLFLSRQLLLSRQLRPNEQLDLCGNHWVSLALSKVLPCNNDGLLGSSREMHAEIR
jgi:hypothetical protein